MQCKYIPNARTRAQGSCPWVKLKSKRGAISSSLFLRFCIHTSLLNLLTTSSRIFEKKQEVRTLIRRWLGIYFFSTHHLRSGLGFGARGIINSRLVLHRLLSCHYVEYCWEFIYHIKETLPVRDTIISSLDRKIAIKPTHTNTKKGVFPCSTERKEEVKQWTCSANINTMTQLMQ